MRYEWKKALERKGKVAQINYWREVRPSSVESLRYTMPVMRGLGSGCVFMLHKELLTSFCGGLWTDFITNY